MVMNYHTSGFPLGITLTIVGIILLVLWCLRKKAVYPLLREYVPVLGKHIDEMNQPERSVRAHEDDFGEDSADEADEKVEPETTASVSDEPMRISGNGEIKQQPTQPKQQPTQPQQQPTQPQQQPVRLKQQPTQPQQQPTQQQPVQPKQQPTQPKQQPTQPKQQPVQPQQQSHPEYKKILDKPAVLTEQTKTNAQPKQTEQKNPQEKPAAVTEQPSQNKQTYSTGEVFEITEDNRGSKK